ncbi:MAG: GlsB/YeaQ/YmgE family stress response membrane protein [Acidobacteria bacterium]|nr:GlsB/YeaQ/YmgE family stress response membrane protein [Acidobacteriota bacterium]
MMILSGLVIGVIAKLIMPGKDPGGIIVTAIIGMVGSLVGTFIGRQFLGFGPTDVAGWPLAIVGSLILLGAYRLLFGRRRSDD